jgi:hypothetical protein
MPHRGVRQVVLGSAILSGVHGGPLLAQRADSLIQGARVRVQFDGPSRGWRRSMEGTVVRTDVDTLVLQSAAQSLAQGIPWSRVRRVETYAGTRSAGAAFGRGARRGAVVGGAIGVGAIVAERVYERTRQCTVHCRRPFLVSFGAVVVTSTTFWGAVIGGGVGLSHREQWTRVRQP